MAHNTILAEEEVPEDWDAGSEDEDAAVAGTSAPPNGHPPLPSKAEAMATESSKSDDEDEDESDGLHGEGLDYAAKVLSDYRRLLSRRVDLVGDYAGNELFLIDGDSLLLRCFSDPHLDFHPGFQLAHAAYNVEQVLHHLSRRKCNFHLVFFRMNKALCTPNTASKVSASKYLLARAAIIRHLKAHLPSSHPDIKIEEFSSYTSSEFREYLAHHAPYFIMAHDGAEAVSPKDKHAATEGNVQAAQLNPNRAALREMILFFIDSGYNISLINGLEWRDTKVMALVLERHQRENRVSVARGLLLSDPNFKADDDVKTSLTQCDKIASHLTQRQLLAVLATSKIITSGVRDLSEPVVLSVARSLLLHIAALMHLPLSARRLPSSKPTVELDEFLQEVSSLAERILYKEDWQSIVQEYASPCDVVDFIDGRLLQQIHSHDLQLTTGMQQTFQEMADVLHSLCGVDIMGHELPIPTQPTPNGISSPSKVGKQRNLAVMPFSNPVFNPHLVSIRLDIDEQIMQRMSSTSHKIFREVTHWHNAKKPIVQKGPPTAQSEKQKSRAAKREQMFMAEMQKYAASLTNAVGRSLEPETIIVGNEKIKILPAQSSSGRATPDSDSTDSTVSQTKKQAPAKKAGGGKKGQQTAGKQAILNQIAATKAKKDEATGDKIINAWRTVCKSIDVGDDPRSKFAKAKAYLASLPSASRDLVAAECQLFMVNCLLQRWIALSKDGMKDQNLELAGLVWSLCTTVLSCKNLTKEVVSNVNLTIKTLDLPPAPSTSSEPLSSRALPYKFVLPTAVDNLSVGLPSKEFQLQFCGPYLEKSFDSAPDPRVDFNPDGWQRRVLDAIDAKRSVFAVAPTSAGKTFISFYAMRKVLEADDNSVLVYVAPTKALVNQIAAEIQARYSKKFKFGGKSVWAIHTRDYRINNPTGCQVLVTVPHVLQIMLLAPSNASSWSTRVKTIILDEIHSIGQAEDGVVWEQLLLLSPCPIIALSATVGNPTEFSDWLQTTQKAIGVDLETVQHPHRYSDLRKYYYIPPKKFAFSGLPGKFAFGTLGLDHATGLNRIHPIAGLVDRSRGIPEDLALEPSDCFELYKAMSKYATEFYPVPAEIDPKNALPEICRKVDILEWERNLKDVLRKWIADANSPFNQLVQDLEQEFRNEKREPMQATQPASTNAMMIESRGPEDLLTWTLSLLCRLHEQDALPAILFNYDRHECEEICRSIVSKLQAAEDQQVKSGPAWSRKLEKFEEWKKVQEKIASSKGGKKMPKKGGDKEDEKASKLDMQRDATSAEASPWETFDPEAPVEGYHFADHSKVLLSEMEIYIRQLKYRDVQDWLIAGLQRGIGIHHAGMNRKYRQVVEILFRKGFLRVVIATGTLALGINMPCKTVVFGGDSVFLTALNYRQCAGRAGRRGFDLLGNVVFHGVSREKVCRLISSRLPDLNGHFPITTTLVLRLFTLLDESKNSKYASSSINALLSQPRLFLGSEAFKDQVMHHLRFSIEYLRRQYLLSASGAPLNFAGLVSHLYFTENSSFAFHALLKEGYFHELCAAIDNDEKNTLETMMLVMAHLFSRVPCRQADEEYKAKVVKPSSSIVFLPPLPTKAANILRSHNRETLDVFRTYVETFVEQHVSATDNKLPLTSITVGTEEEVKLDDCGVQSLPPTKTRSSFVALSGHSDDFASITDLCHTMRDGVFLEEAVIPYVGIHPDETNQPLNAWLLDFFKHGDVHTIERANGIRRSEIWFMLNDFSLVLATIISSLMGFMKLKPQTDMDMLDVTGQGDAFEEAQDDAAAAEEQPDGTSTDTVGPSTSIPERPKQISKKKTKNASWEDLADEEEARDDAEMMAEADAEADQGWNPDEEGLRKVLQAFTRLHAEFNVKFRAMWA